ncbi:hypothetical protein OC842_007108 [Tilletia horrida]|uniref:protein-histidine N-methyltransferase n=1 Tax=Tilletia horrida TaxID=155126 RepID=A0AAN6G4J4_9BASI|nr:hypothetical protein OC842_007108 [Tilletia horrida]
MSFQFSFADSAELELEHEQDGEGVALPADADTETKASSQGSPSGPQVQPREWPWDELVRTLPPFLSYSPIAITLDSAPHKLHLARRDLFDARFQMLNDNDDNDDDAEAKLGNSLDALHIASTQSTGVGADSDLVPGVYEGGLKTWECAADLIAELHARIQKQGTDRLQLRGKRIIELGCGTALPSMYILAQLLQEAAPASGPSESTEIHLADFNPEVLRLVTLPNLILTWYFFSPAAAPFRAASAEPSDQDKNKAQEQPPPHPSPSTTGELDLSTDALLSTFQTDLASTHNIHLRFFSGPWSRPLADLLLSSPPASAAAGKEREAYDIVLSSETVYSLHTLPALTDMLYTACHPAERSEGDSHAAAALCLVAAKVLYFGVGGGVHSFVQAVERGHLASPPPAAEGRRRRPKGQARVVREVRAGVGRAVLQVSWADESLE